MQAAAAIESRHRGDTDFLAGLFDAHAGAVARLLERLLGAGPHVDDLVQDVFLVAHRRRADVRAADSERAWLYAVALNVGRAWRRRRGRRAGLWRRFDPRATTPAPDSPEADALRSEQGAALRACLDALPERFREVVVLYELEGLEGAEIAALLGVPVNTVWSRLKTARDKLRDMLRRRGITSAGGRP